MSTPCIPFPEDATFKTIALAPCTLCKSTECWLNYLRWEVKAEIMARRGVDEHVADERGMGDGVTQVADAQRFTDPQESIDLAVTILNRMRELFAGSDANIAPNAAVNVLIEAAAWLIVRAAPTSAVVTEAAATFGALFQKMITTLDSARDGAGTDLPQPDQLSYKDDDGKTVDDSTPITAGDLEKLCMSIAPRLNQSLNEPFTTKRIGFFLSLFEFGPPGKPLAYVSSANGADLKVALNEIVQRTSDLAQRADKKEA